MPKILALILSLAVLYSVNAFCPCPVRFTGYPRYCNVDRPNQFFALVKVTGVVVHQQNHQQQIYFELLQDLTLIDSRIHRTSLVGHPSINLTTTAFCTFTLNINHDYLMVGDFDAQTEKPQMTPCFSHIEDWNYTPEKSAQTLAEYKVNCNKPDPLKPHVDN